VFDLIECLEQPHLDRAVLFRFAESAGVTCRPLFRGFPWQEDAYRERRLAIRGDVEYVFSNGALRRVVHRRALSHKVILVNVSLSAGIGFHAANGHRAVVVLCRWSSAVGPRL